MATSVDIQLDRAIAERIAVAQELLLRSDGKGAFSVSYTFGTKAAPVDFGASNTDLIAPPAGLRGVIKSLDVYDVTETFNDLDGGGARGAHVLVGISSDTDLYATIPNAVAGFVELAAAAGANFAPTDGSTTILPADTDILVSFIQSNHAAPAGKGVVTLTINFFV